MKKEKKEQLLLAVYGTMRTGGALSQCVPSAYAIGESELMVISGLRMHVVGACPAMKPGEDEDDKCVIELWELELTKKEKKEVLGEMDRVEGVSDGLYERGYIDTPRGKALIYFYCGDVTGAPVVQDWMKWLEKPLRERIEVLERSGVALVTVGGSIV